MKDSTAVQSQQSQFDLNAWKRRFQYNSELAERNASMDSGWSQRVAEQTVTDAMILYRELVIALADTETKSEDFFDRAELVKLQEAARFACGKGGER